MQGAMGRSWHEAEDRRRKRQEQAKAGGRSRQKQAEAGRTTPTQQEPETEAGRGKRQEQEEVVGGGQCPQLTATEVAEGWIRWEAEAERLGGRR